MNTSTDKAVSEVVGVFTDPIIVYPGGWGDSLPEWLKNAIALERLEMNLRALKGEKVTGTDAEACAYLYTASFAVPMDNDWVQIYLHISSRTCRRWGGKEMPADITVDSLNGEQTKDLRRLKGWLHQKRAQERGNRDRAERRQHKEEEPERRKAEQPALFDF